MQLSIEIIYIMKKKCQDTARFKGNKLATAGRIMLKRIN